MPRIESISGWSGLYSASGIVVLGSALVLGDIVSEKRGKNATIFEFFFGRDARKDFS